MNLLLINTGNDPGLGGHVNAQSYPPLGIISLGTAVRDVFGNAVQVSLADGQVDDVDDLASRIRRERPDVVGLSMYCTSTRNTLRLVREAKGIGATTIIGNDHAAFHFETLLTKVPEVDYVCTGDVGEDSLVALMGCLLGRPNADRLSEVPDLAFRHEERVVASAVRRHRAGAGAMDDIAIPDRTLLPERYWSHYLSCFKRQHRKLFNSSAVPGIATINRARGCARSKSPCRYCGIADLTPRGSSADLFWRDVRQAREEVGATVLHEVFDSATSWPRLCRR